MVYVVFVLTEGEGLIVCERVCVHVYMRQLKRQEVGEKCCFQLVCQPNSHVRVGGLYKQPYYILDE